MPMPDFLASLQDNPYFGAGFGLVGLGAGLAALRKASMLATIYLRRRYLITLEVPCRDKSYQWLLRWMTTENKTAQHVSVETIFKQQETGKINAAFKFIPSVGTHFFQFKNRWFKVERNREQSTLDLHMGVPFETVTLTTVGRDPNLYDYILSNARDLALAEEEGKTIVYTAVGHEWRQFGNPRNRRPISSVILDEGISERILKDLKEFMDNKSWYTERGIPYRRGYLLYGPPGCGKSSYINALAGELEYSICVLHLSERGLSDDRLQHLISVAPEQSIILLEDIDAAFGNREQESTKTKMAYEGLNQVTLSGLLNMLDGVVSSEGRIFFMTTNYEDRLDKALIRPGRVDVRQGIAHASDYQLETMYEKFYPEQCKKDPPLSKIFMKKIRELKDPQGVQKPISLAAIQGLFMCYKNDPIGVIQNVQTIENL